MTVVSAPCEHPLDRFGATMARLALSHPRRIGLLLAQFGLLVTVAGFCVSIVAMNIGLVTSLAGCLLAGAPLHRLPISWAFLAYLVTLALSTISHGEWRELVKTAVIPLGLLTAQVTMHHAIPGAARLRRAMIITLIVCVAASTLLSLGQFLIGRGRNRPLRIDPDGAAFSQTSGFFGLHLTQGGVMGMLFFLIPALADKAWRWRWTWLGAVATGLAVVISGARSALLGTTAGWFTMVATGGRRRLLLAGTGSLLLVGAGLLVLFTTQRARFDRLITLQDGRWPVWKTSLVVAGDHPLIGTGGTASFREAYRLTYPSVVPDITSEFPGGAAHAHHTQIAHAAEHGLPFALAWLCMLSVAGLHLWRRRMDHPHLFQCGVGLITTTLIFGQFEKLDGECSRVLWTGLGMLVALTAAPPKADISEQHDENAASGPG